MRQWNDISEQPKWYFKTTFLLFDLKKTHHGKNPENTTPNTLITVISFFASLPASFFNIISALFARSYFGRE